jgi:sugar phosphate isomerase/epimerase
VSPLCEGTKVVHDLLTRLAHRLERTPPMAFRLAVQQALLPGRTPMDQFSHAAEYGFAGVELNHTDRFDVRIEHELIADASRATGVAVAAICTTGRQDPVYPEHEERNRRVHELADLVDVASALGATGVVSVPIRPAAEFDDAQLPDLAIDIYRRVCERLGAGAAAVFLEPLNRYEARFLNRVGQAAMLARMVGHPRIRALADLYHMNIEETSFEAPIEEAGELLGHVHLADNTRQEPGAGMMDYHAAFRALRAIGYDGWLSLECRNLSGPPEVALPACARYLQSVWDEAGVL